MHKQPIQHTDLHGDTSCKRCFPLSRHQGQKEALVVHVNAAATKTEEEQISSTQHNYFITRIGTADIKEGERPAQHVKESMKNYNK